MWGFVHNFLCPSFQGIYCPLQFSPPTRRFLEICESFVSRMLVDALVVGSVVWFIAWLSVWHVHQQTAAQSAADGGPDGNDGSAAIAMQ